MRYLDCSQDWIQKAFWQVVHVHVWFAKRRFAKKNSTRNSLNLSYQIPNKQEECNHCIMSQLAPFWGLSYEKDIFLQYAYTLYNVDSLFYEKCYEIFFVYTSASEVYNSELIESHISDNKTNGKDTPKAITNPLYFLQ